MVRSSLFAVVLGCLSLPAQEGPERGFETRQLSPVFTCEGAAAGDFDGDGKTDIVSGPWIWRGPDFERRFEIAAPKAFDPKGYSENFFSFPHDLDRDGRLDVVVVGFPGRETWWFRNPGHLDARWPRHRVFETTDNESPGFVDLTGDGQPELVCQTKGRLGYATYDAKDPSLPWVFHPVSGPDAGGAFTHGLGAGDLDGDGRVDLVTRTGWWQQPESLGGDPQWTHHPEPFGEQGGAQMLVVDVDGDGDADLVTSLNAHGFGLVWFEQRRDGAAPRFVRHRITGATPEESTEGLVVGNLHALCLADIDGDGVRDIVTGNRYWAHSGRDIADQRAALLVWFRCVRTPGETRFVAQVVHDDSGVGTQVFAADVTGDGRTDIVVGNKKGTWLHVQKPGAKPLAVAAIREPSAAVDPGERPKGLDGTVLNLDFETGDLRHWSATGSAFTGLPVRGDVVHRRRADMRSRHQGEYWVGTYEPEGSDRSQGTLTSDPFEIREPWASFLVGGGHHDSTAVELVVDGSGEVIHRQPGRDEEDLRRVVVDLRAHLGKRLRVRLVDRHGGHWGHVNFDDFRVHRAEPKPTPEATPDGPPTGWLGADAALRMTVPKGFQVDLIAAEPDIHQPIAFTIDDRGRLWVAEAYAYPIRQPEGQGKDRILVLSDEDHDGGFETRREFATGLNLVSGIEVGFGGVYVGAAPYLLFIPDRNDDLVPDAAPEVLLDGFGWQDTHETLNAFNFGPDGWLYGCHGVFTHSRVGKPGTPDAERIPMNAAVWRYHPIAKRFEIFAWGASNQWGVDFDDRGQAFITACVIPHLYHVIQGGRYERQAGQHFDRFVFDDLKTIADHRHYVGETPHGGNGISGNVGGGHAHCGALVYLGDAFPPEYRGSLLMSNIHGNRVNRDLLVPKGSGFVGSHADDLVLSNDPWFRCVGLRTGPDGAVYFIDWYDKQACHRTTPEIWDRSNGRLYRLRYGEPRPLKRPVRQYTSAELVEAQLHRNDWFVRTARRVLAERGPNDEVHASLRRLFVEQTDPTRRLRALWALHAVRGLDAETIGRAFTDPAPEVRAWIVQLVLDPAQPAGDFFDSLYALAVNDPSPMVRLYVAAAMQRLRLPERASLAGALLAHEEDRDDHNLPRMIWFGLEPVAADDPERAVVLASKAKIPLVRRFLWRRLAAGSPAHRQALVRYLETSRKPPEEREILEEMVAGVPEGAAIEIPPGFDSVIGRFLSGRDAATRELALEIAARFRDPSVAPHFRALVRDRGAKPEDRTRALRVLVGLKDPELPAVIRGLLGDPGMRDDAIRAAGVVADAGLETALIEGARGWPATSQREAAAVLATRAGSALAFLQAIESGTLPKELLGDAPLRRRLVGHREERIGALLTRLWGRARAPDEDKAALVATTARKFPPNVLRSGDRSRGRALFTKTCANCHTLFGVGRKVGPDLTGANRSDVGYLLGNILDPNAEVAKEYQVVSVDTTDDRLLDGILVAEDEHSVTLALSTETVRIPRSEIALDEAGKPSIRPSPNSMMPDDQIQKWSDEEVRDLLAYLGSTEQVPLRADASHVGRLFNGRDLSFLDADPAVWSVEGGELVGRSLKGLAANSFAVSHLLLGDFRLIVKVKLAPDTANSGIQFRSRPAPKGEMVGYQADIGAGWWGKLYEESGRGLLVKEGAEAAVKPGDWNVYEILARGSRIETAINGVRSVAIDDPSGAREGVLGFQVHSGGPTEVRFREFELEVDPAAGLKTLR